MKFSKYLFIAILISLFTGYTEISVNGISIRKPYLAITVFLVFLLLYFILKKLEKLYVEEKSNKNNKTS